MDVFLWIELLFIFLIKGLFDTLHVILHVEVIILIIFKEILLSILILYNLTKLGAYKTNLINILIDLWEVRVEFNTRAKLLLISLLIYQVFRIVIGIHVLLPVHIVLYLLRVQQILVVIVQFCESPMVL